MNVSIRNLLLACIAVAMLVPSQLRVAGVTIFDACIYATLLLACAAALMRGGFSWERQDGIELTLFGFAILSLFTYVALSHSFDTQLRFLESLGQRTDFLLLRLSLYGFGTLVLLLGVYRLASRSFIRDGDFAAVVRVIIVSGTINALVTLAYWFVVTGGIIARYNYLPPLENSQGVHLDRMAMTFMFALAVWAASRGRRRWLMALVMACTSLSIATVMVRMGWVVFLVSVFLFVLLSGEKLLTKRKVLAIAAAVVLVLMAGYYVITNSKGVAEQVFVDILHPPKTSTEPDLLIRLKLARRGLAIFLSHPWVGVGYGHYTAYSTEPVILAGQYTYVASPHNGIVAVASETGIVGLLGFAWLCGALLQLCRRAKSAAPPGLTRSIATAILALFLPMLAVQMIANTIVLPEPADRTMTQAAFLWWVLFGAAAAMVKNARRHPASAVTAAAAGD